MFLLADTFSGGGITVPSFNVGSFISIIWGDTLINLNGAAVLIWQPFLISMIPEIPLDRAPHLDLVMSVLNPYLALLKGWDDYVQDLVGTLSEFLMSQLHSFWIASLVIGARQ